MEFHICRPRFIFLADLDRKMLSFATDVFSDLGCARKTIQWGIERNVELAGFVLRTDHFLVLFAHVSHRFFTFYYLQSPSPTALSLDIRCQSYVVVQHQLVRPSSATTRSTQRRGGYSRKLMLL